MDVADKPYAFVKHQMTQGKNEISFLSRLLEAGDKDPEEQFTNKWSAMALYTAGADTVRPLSTSVEACPNVFRLCRQLLASFWL